MSGAPTAAVKGRRLVVCCDGTNNSLTGGQRDTNVLQIYRHLRSQWTDPQDFLYYDPGVGVADAAPPTGLTDWLSRHWERVRELASGRGVYHNIEQAYLFLMRHWSGPDDRIYLFGFSRGAFTARAVAGMVNLFGILRPELETVVPTLVHIYFSRRDDDKSLWGKLLRSLNRLVKRDGDAKRSALAEQVQQQFTTAAGRNAWVHWVGVWDTVDSVGLPGPLKRDNPSNGYLVGKRIRHARHALALDEHRLSFTPRLYEEPGDLSGPEQTLKQRWFPGVHSDVGGGYPSKEAGLSDITLAWMVDELRQVEGEHLLESVPEKESVRLLRHDPLWLTPWWALVGMTLRDMRPRARNPQPQKPPATELPKGDGMRKHRIAVISDSSARAPESSQWDKRRPVWSVALAVIGAMLFIVLSGRCLLPDDPDAPRGASEWLEAIDATRVFAGEQLAALWGGGLMLPGRAPWEGGVQVAWAMWYDLAFIACWGYLLARIASRGFAWLAGDRVPGAAMPAWHWLGLAPLAAVGGDVLEDLLTMAAMVGHNVAADLPTHVALWLVGVAALIKTLGLVACLPWLVVRYWIAFAPTIGSPAPEKTRRRSGGLFALFFASLLLVLGWLFARLTVCWGSYGVLGSLLCNSHYAVGLLLVLGSVWLIQQRGDMARSGQRWTASPSALISALLMVALLLGCLWLLLMSPIRF